MKLSRGLDEANSILPVVFQVLQRQLATFIIPRQKDNGGEIITTGDHIFLSAAQLFQKMNLGEIERSSALSLLASWSDNTGRIFIDMLLLPAMLDLGLPGDKCLAICQTGLHRSEGYYRIHAARLLSLVSQKYPVGDLELDVLIHDPEVAVRVHAAKSHWLKHRQAGLVVPVLVEALDRSKNQSYYYQQILAVALATLGSIGPEAREAAGALEEVAHDPNPLIANLASDALLKIRR